LTPVVPVGKFGEVIRTNLGAEHTLPNSLDLGLAEHYLPLHP
jgi:hypothetical protein